EPLRALSKPERFRLSAIVARTIPRGQRRRWLVVVAVVGARQRRPLLGASAGHLLAALPARSSSLYPAREPAGPGFVTPAGRSRKAWSCSGKAEATVHAGAIRPSFRPAISPARLGIEREDARRDEGA